MEHRQKAGPSTQYLLDHSIDHASCFFNCENLIFSLNELNERMRGHPRTLLSVQLRHQPTSKPPSSRQQRSLSGDNGPVFNRSTMSLREHAVDGIVLLQPWDDRLRPRSVPPVPHQVTHDGEESHQLYARSRHAII